MSHRTLKAALVDYYHDRPHHEDETQEDGTIMTGKQFDRY